MKDLKPDPIRLISIGSATIAPTFGGINLEDIKAPECFEIERRLESMLDIPVFHDDQHGTAIISGAGLLNALELVKKDISKIKIVISGAGASAISCAKMAVLLGAKRENIFAGRQPRCCVRRALKRMEQYKQEFIQKTDARELKNAIKARMFSTDSQSPMFSRQKWRKYGEDPRILHGESNPKSVKVHKMSD